MGKRNIMVLFHGCQREGHGGRWGNRQMVFLVIFLPCHPLLCLYLISVLRGLHAIWGSPQPRSLPQSSDHYPCLWITHASLNGICTTYALKKVQGNSEGSGLQNSASWIHIPDRCRYVSQWAWCFKKNRALPADISVNPMGHALLSMTCLEPSI